MYLLIINVLVFVHGRHEHQGPAFGVIECPDVHSVRSGIRVLDDFPCVSIPCNARDSNYQVSHPVLTYPGAYRKVSVELKIHHLAVNALLKRNRINEMEGGALFGFDLDISGAHEQTVWL